MCPNNSTGSPKSETTQSSSVNGMGEQDVLGSSERTIGQRSVELKGGLFGQEKKWQGIDRKVGPFLRRGAVVALTAWILGMSALFTFAPADSYERLEGAERTANMIVLAVLVYSNTSRFLQLIMRDKSFVFVNTGVLFGAAMVQILAIVSISIMLFLPTPVFFDSVTGMRSHAVRWVEWVVLAFLMTFLTESMNMPLEKNPNTSVAWLHGIAIALSTSAGGLFPLCPNWTWWLAMLCTSWVLFCSLFVRLHQRYQRLQSMPSTGTVDQREEYNRAKYSLKTIAVCTVVWTLLAGSHTVIALLRPLVSKDSFLAADSLTLVSESIFETISKVWYFNLLLEVHNIVFDDASRIVRRLEELRMFMSTIWDTSTDVMIWCSSLEGTIHAVVSPAFFDLCPPPAEKKMPNLSHNNRRPTLILEVNQAEGSFSYRIIRLDMSEAITRQDALDMMFDSVEKRKKKEEADCLTEKNIGVVASLLSETFLSNKKDMVLMTEMHAEAEDEEGTTVRCEAKVSKMGQSCLVTIRDISERFQRFETEKKLVAERTARRKDAEANRFTRHEVKNSILAAIGVLESIRSTNAPTTSKAPLPSITIERRDSGGGISAGGPGGNESASGSDVEYTTFDDHAGELDNTLRTVLDTIMDHAMSRDVINEEYELRKERVMVPDVLANIKRLANSSSPRFALHVSPQPFPMIGLDPRLLRYIYQNALSNACRYGKHGGPVDTSIFYDDKTKEFRLEVSNQPGVGHEELVTLPHDEIQEKVFSAGSRLHKKTLDENEMSVTNSSGDGAWIMGKCVGIMKGRCDLRFEPDRTVFSFSCPAKKHTTKERAEEELRSLPENTWGVVIDDSGIQRKLMDRYLKIAGIDKDRRVIVGKDTAEIYGFTDMVVELVQKHPDSKFLVIADENLDVLEGVALHGTVSGSACLQRILEKLNDEDEARVLALVRSANDSATEADLYKSRAHGYLVKAPIDKNGVLSAIRPWWTKRFPKKAGEGGQSSSNSVSSMDTEDYDPYADVKENIEVLDALCSVSGISLRNRWRTIRERLQALKGDLKSTISRNGLDLTVLVEAIDTLRSGKAPDDLPEQWATLRDQIHQLLDSAQ